MFSFRVDDELKIELIQQQHKEELFRLIDTNREHLRKWLLWVDKRQTAEDFDTIIPQWISKFANNDGFDAGIRYKGRLVGMIGLHHIDWKNKATSIGYFLSEEAQGNRIITKCVRALITYLFDELDLHRIEIQCAETNHRSRTIPIKLGFFEEGVSRDGDGYTTIMKT